MPTLMERIKDAFSTNPTMSRAMVEEAWLQRLKNDEDAKMKDAQRLLDYYYRDRAGIIEYATKTAVKIFSTEELADWQWPMVNEVFRITNRLSMAYKTPPQRMLINEKGEPIKEGAKEYQIFAEMFQGMDLDRKLKQTDRMATLFNTIHVEVVKRHGVIDWDIRLRATTAVVPDPTNEYLPYRFSYKWNPMDPDKLTPLTGWVVWEKERHFFIGENGKAFSMINEDPTDFSNPYEQESDLAYDSMPVVVIRKLEQDDYWGRLGADLVDGVESSIIQLGNVWETAILQSHGQPVGTNLGLPEGTKLRTGCKWPLLIDGVSKDKVPPKLEFINPNPKLKEVLDLIDWFLSSQGQSYGMPASAFSKDEKDLSGFAKFIDNIELLENREEEVPMWAMIESELFKKSVMVWNEWAEEGSKMPDGVSLQSTFKAVSFPQSPTEQMEELALEIQNGVNSPSHFIAERDGISLDKATEKAKEYAQANKELKQASSGGIEAVFQKLNAKGSQGTVQPTGEQTGKEGSQQNDKGAPG